MKTQVLKDSKNRNIGKIIYKSDGKIELRDGKNKFKGIYDPKSDITKDEKNRKIGKGNLLTMLL